MRSPKTNLKWEHMEQGGGSRRPLEPLGLKEASYDAIAPMIVAGLIGAGASVAGGLINSISSSNAQSKANKANQEIANQNLALQREQFEYQKKLQQQVFNREDTAHQREVQDLRNAGINPLATANGGSGAGAGAVVPITEMSNNYQEQSTGGMDLQLGQAAQIGLNAYQAKRTEDIQRDQMKQALQTHNAEMEMKDAELRQRQYEAQQNLLQQQAELAAKNKQWNEQKKIQEAARDLAREQFEEEKRRYKENEETRSAQERIAKAEASRKEHDNALDTGRGTKSSENVDSKYTTAKAGLQDAKKFGKKTEEKYYAEAQKRAKGGHSR